MCLKPPCFLVDRDVSHKVFQPCLCLCLGFSQITRITPFLLMTLHFSHMGLTEDLTFISLLLSQPLGHDFPAVRRNLDIITPVPGVVTFYLTFRGIHAAVFLTAADDASPVYKASADGFRPSQKASGTGFLPCLHNLRTGFLLCIIVPRIGPGLLRVYPAACIFPCKGYLISHLRR